MAARARLSESHLHRMKSIDLIGRVGSAVARHGFQLRAVRERVLPERRQHPGASTLLSRRAAPPRLHHAELGHVELLVGDPAGEALGLVADEFE